MNTALTNTSLVLLTLLSAAASVVALLRLRAMMAWASRPGEAVGSPEAAAPLPKKTLLNLLVALVALGAGTILVIRWLEIGEGWNPLSAHLDGLLLIASLLAVVDLFIQSRPRLGGLAVFILPVLTFILAWAICASAWTDRPFVESLSPVWMAVHLVGVYLGTLGSALAAIAGGMYLVVERQLKAKRNPRSLLGVASLETLERLIVQSATLGFALLTLGLVSGVVILRHDGSALLGEGWWAEPKVVLAFAAWLVYAVVMNVRFASVFRGRRAAWLAIGGFVLLLAVYGIVTGGQA